MPGEPILGKPTDVDIDHESSDIWGRDAAVATALALATALTFGVAIANGFVDLDDQLYVTQNTQVQAGLSWQGLVWAATAGAASNWHPLTWLSHMLDWQLFGGRAAGHHGVNVLLHAINAGLAYMVLRAMTTGHRGGHVARATGRRGRHGSHAGTSPPAGRADRAPKETANLGLPPAEQRSFGNSRWACALVAGLFALHPLRVESVAWVSERKDVLSTLFYLAATWAYVSGARGDQGWGSWALVGWWFGLGLLSKPMLVTWPVAMLLIDYWPLYRLRLNDRGTGIDPWSWLPLVREKLPWFILAAAVSGVTVAVQTRGGAVLTSGAIPLVTQWTFVPAAYWGYLWRSFVPLGLCCFYPLPLAALRSQPWLYPPVLAGVVALLACSYGAWKWRYVRPWLGFGWAWFVLTLLPVVGLIKVGDQALADRYTYVPHLGLWVAVVWSGREWVAKRPGWRVAVSCGSAVLLVALAGMSAWLTTTWRDTRTLAERALRLTRDNYVAHYLVGVAEQQRGETGAARREFEAAVELNPHYYFAAQDLGTLLFEEGDVDGAMTWFTRLVSEQPQWPGGHVGQAAVFARRGQLVQAQQSIERAVAWGPSDARTLVQAGEILATQGKFAEAADRFERAQRLEPGMVLAARRLAELRLREERFAEASAAAQQALELAPQDASLSVLVAEIHLRRNQAPDAVRALRRALELDDSQAAVANQLAWILATHPDPSLRNGAEAVDWALHACQSEGADDPALLDTLAAAYAEQGRWDDAVNTATQALGLARAAGPEPVAAEIEARLELYRQRKPYRSS